MSKTADPDILSFQQEQPAVPFHPASRWITKQGLWPDHLDDYIRSEVLPEIHLSRVSALFRHLYMHCRQAFPNPENWLAPTPIVNGEMYYIAKTHQRASQLDFIKSVWPQCVIILADNLTNKHWLANVIIMLAIFDLLRSHTSFLLKTAHPDSAAPSAAPSANPKSDV